MELRQQFESCLRIFHASLRETAVADDAENVFGEAHEIVHRLLVCSGEHHLWPSSHSQRGGVGVERLGSEALALGEDVAIEVGQDGGVEADAVFHQEYHLHSRLVDVVFEVHLVLDEFYDREDEVGIAEPAEHVFEYREVFVHYPLRDAMREWREHHAWNVGKLPLHRPRHGEGVVVGISWHTYHEVDARGGEHFGGFHHGAHLSEGGRIAKAELCILIENLFIHSPVVFEHEGIVWVCDNEDIENTMRHQVLE